MPTSINQAGTKVLHTFEQPQGELSQLDNKSTVKIGRKTDGEFSVTGDAQTVHWYSRDKNKSAIRTTNLQTLAAVEAALISKGGTPALEAFQQLASSSILKGDKPLKVSQLRDALNSAIPPANNPDFWVAHDRAEYFLNDATQNFRLMTSPQELLDAIAEGTEIWNQAAQTGFLHNADIYQNLKVRIRNLKDRSVQIKIDANPLSQNAFMDGIRGKFAAATNIVNKLVPCHAIESLSMALSDAQEEVIAKIRNDGVTPDSEAAAAYMEQTNESIAEILKGMVGEKMTTEGGQPRTLKDKDVTSLLKQESIAQLNHPDRWQIVCKQLLIPVENAGDITATSTITPAAYMGDIFENDYRGTGVSSTDIGNAQHAVNLAYTSLEVPDGAGGAKQIFQAVRHGVNSAFGIKKGAARRAANEVRAKEVLTAIAQGAVRKNRDLIAQGQGTNVLYLPVTSLSLLTPDAFRYGHANEAKYRIEQNEAWPRDPIEVKVIDPDDPQGRRTITISVMPKLAAFNFPVNEKPQGSNPLVRALGGGYLASYWQNVEAFNTLFGEDFMNGKGDEVPEVPLGGTAGAQLANLDNDTDKDTVRELAIQCRELWNNDGHKAPKETPYRLPARLAMLTSLLGTPPAFNCKSGKDRTGQLDVEAKAVAIFIHTHNGHPPAVSGTDKAAHDVTMRAIRTPIALEGGNHEMQIKNTGFAGFKTLKVKGLVRAFGADIMPRIFGFSKLVKD